MNRLLPTAILITVTALSARETLACPCDADADEDAPAITDLEPPRPGEQPGSLTISEHDLERLLRRIADAEARRHDAAVPPEHGDDAANRR